jgi:hypothetical protein
MKTHNGVSQAHGNRHLSVRRVIGRRGSYGIVPKNSQGRKSKQQYDRGRVKVSCPSLTKLVIIIWVTVIFGEWGRWRTREHAR